jgi:hypothetical protein
MKGDRLSACSCHYTQPSIPATRSSPPAACSHCIPPDLSCAPPALPHVPVEALLWVLSTEHGCELRIFESAAGRPTMQVRPDFAFLCNCGLVSQIRSMQTLTEHKLEETCVVKGSALMLPWCSHSPLPPFHKSSHSHPLLRQFKYYAKDFGDHESERLATLARLMGSKGPALLKVFFKARLPSIRHPRPDFFVVQLAESVGFKTKVQTPPEGGVTLTCHIDVRRSTRYAASARARPVFPLLVLPCAIHVLSFIVPHS